ncbi:MAG: hypothetical protein ACFFAN_21185 [Promethearchaeota archaeon]
MWLECCVCPQNSISLKLREGGEEPFNKLAELGKAILENKRKTYNKKY